MASSDIGHIADVIVSDKVSHVVVTATVAEDAAGSAIVEAVGADAGAGIPDFQKGIAAFAAEGIIADNGIVCFQPQQHTVAGSTAAELVGRKADVTGVHIQAGLSINIDGGHAAIIAETVAGQA